MKNEHTPLEKELIKALEKICHLPDFIAADSYTNKRSMQDPMAVANYAHEVANEAIRKSESPEV